MSKISNPSESVRPTLAFYKPNLEDTGSAVKFSLQPATCDMDGHIFMAIAKQRHVKNDTKPSFNWDSGAAVSLDFDDLCEILQVLRGEKDNVGDRNGFLLVTVAGYVTVKFRHRVDPVAGYYLDVYKFDRKTSNRTGYHFLFNPAEACGLREALAGAMHRIAFGD